MLRDDKPCFTHEQNGFSEVLCDKEFARRESRAEKAHGCFGSNKGEQNGQYVQLGYLSFATRTLNSKQKNC